MSAYRQLMARADRAKTQSERHDVLMRAVYMKSRKVLNEDKFNRVKSVVTK